MKELLLKRALPFALTFAVGAAVGGFFQLFGAGRAWGGPRYTYSYGNRRGCGKKFRPNYFAPETKPPVILFKPDAHVPRPEGQAAARPLPERVRVRVQFGEDGKVLDANPYVEGEFVSAGFYEAAMRAARHIRFIPAAVDGVPTATTEVVEIRVTPE